MKGIVTDDKSMAEQTVAMAQPSGATIEVEDLGDDRLRVTMSAADAAKLLKVDD